MYECVCECKCLLCTLFVMSSVCYVLCLSVQGLSCPVSRVSRYTYEWFCVWVLCALVYVECVCLCLNELVCLCVYVCVIISLSVFVCMRGCVPLYVCLCKTIFMYEYVFVLV